MSDFCNKSKLIVLFGPSASGRTTLLTKLLNDYPNTFGFSIRHTTRKPRQYETNGVDYHFTTFERMFELIAKGNFVENVDYCDNLYGTSREAIESVTRQGKICVLDICIFGVKQIKETFSEGVSYIFVKPSSLEEVEHRLKVRNTEHGQDFINRVKMAKEEMSYGADPNNSDLILINKDLDETYNQLLKFIEDKVLGAKLVN